MNGTRPWFSDDIAKILRSLVFAVRDNESEDFKRGFLSCVMAICYAIGIDAQEVHPDGRTLRQ